MEKFKEFNPSIYIKELNSKNVDITYLKLALFNAAKGFQQNILGAFCKKYFREQNYFHSL